MPAAPGGKKQAGIESRSESVECLYGSKRQGDSPQRASLLPIELHGPVRVDPADVDDASVTVDVGAFKREPLLRA
jgi:hypothetical protein